MSSSSRGVRGTPNRLNALFAHLVRASLEDKTQQQQQQQQQLSTYTEPPVGDGLVDVAHLGQHPKDRLCGPGGIVIALQLVTNLMDCPTRHNRKRKLIGFAKKDKKIGGGARDEAR